jgi:hypothetical protein
LNLVSVLMSEFIWLWVNVVVITIVVPWMATWMPLFAVFKAAVTEAGGIAPETMFSSAVNTCWARFSKVALVTVTPGCRDPVAFRTV